MYEKLFDDNSREKAMNGIQYFFRHQKSFHKSNIYFISKQKYNLSLYVLFYEKQGRCMLIFLHIWAIFHSIANELNTLLVNILHKIFILPKLSTPKIWISALFWNLLFAYVLFANSHINVKIPNRKTCAQMSLTFPTLIFFYSRIFSKHEDLLVYPSLYLSRFIRIVAGKVKPGWMQDYYKCIFCPWIQYNLYF